MINLYMLASLHACISPSFDNLENLLSAAQEHISVISDEDFISEQKNITYTAVSA